MKTWIDYLKRGLGYTPFEDDLNPETGRRSMKEQLKTLLPYAWSHKRNGVLGAACILVSTALMFPQPMLHRFLIDEVILRKRIHLLPAVIIAIAVLVVISKAAGLLQQFYFKRFEQDVILDIQNRLVDRLLRYPKMFFDKTHTGYLMSRISSDLMGMSWFFSSVSVRIVASVLKGIGGVFFLFYLEWHITLGIILVLPVVYFFVRFFSGKLHHLSKHWMEHRALAARHLQESLASIPLIKAFSREDGASRKLMDAFRKSYDISIEQATVGSTANTIVGLLPEVLRFAVLVAGAVWIIQDKWTLGSLFAYQSYLGYIFSPVLMLASAGLQFQNARASLERITALFDVAPEENTASGYEVRKLKGEIAFRDVGFAYDARQPVLENISFHLEPGQRLAIVGASGEGKTTLISLILRFYLPTTGEILFDGKPAGYYNVRALRRRIGYVSQDIYILSGPVSDVIRFGNPDMSRERVREAARAADALGFIESLPEGFDTLVGENGIRLSRGQKQRLSLARALAIDPDILILDEPATALDKSTEHHIFDALPESAAGKTLIMISHRRSIVETADLVLVLSGGRVHAVGSHDTLMERCALYRELLVDAER